jgi:hypothetical protein
MICAGRLAGARCGSRRSSDGDDDDDDVSSSDDDDVYFDSTLVYGCFAVILCII